MSAFARFEILLPLQFNDGRAVPRDLLAETAFEIQARFGGVTWESQLIEGIWKQGGIEYRDKLNRLFVVRNDEEDEDKKEEKPKPKRKKKAKRPRDDEDDDD